PFRAGESAGWQHDDLSWTAEQIGPLLGGVHADRPDVEAVRRRLIAWNRRLSRSSTEATLYELWERALLRSLAGAALEPAVASDFAARPDSATAVLVPALTRPSRAWFPSDRETPTAARDRLIVDCLTRAADEAKTLSPPDARWGSAHTTLFAHPLAVTEAARRRFNVGPFETGGGSGTLMATTGRTL